MEAIRVTAEDAQALVGQTADITEWGDDEESSTITYLAAKVTGFTGGSLPYLTIAMSGPAEKSDAETGESYGFIPAAPDLNVFIWSICGLGDIRTAN